MDQVTKKYIVESDQVLTCIYICILNRIFKLGSMSEARTGFNTKTKCKL